MIGQACMIYANENRGAFPRTRFDTDKADTVNAFTNWKARDPFPKDGPKANDVTAALFLLVRQGDITADVFVCPASEAKAVRFGELTPGKSGGPVAASAEHISNFPSPDNLSYSYANPYVGNAGRSAGFKMNFTLNSDFVIASDLNPGGPALAKVKAADLPAMNGPADIDRAAFAADVTDATKPVNSTNHAGLGQNVLYADGHVAWQATPFCGMPRADGGRDNVFTRQLEAGAPASADPVAGPPMDGADSVLLPSAEMGKKVRAAPGGTSAPAAPEPPAGASKDEEQPAPADEEPEGL